MISVARAPAWTARARTASSSASSAADHATWWTVQARGQELERLVRGGAQLDGVDHAVAGLAEGRAGELEEGQDRARGAALIAEVQVVDVRLIEVDRLLDQAQAEHPRIEVDVAR